MAECADKIAVATGGECVMAAEIARPQQAATQTLGRNVLDIDQRLAISVGGNTRECLVEAFPVAITAKLQIPCTGRKIRTAADFPKMSVVGLNQCAVVPRFAIK